MVLLDAERNEDEISKVLKVWQGESSSRRESERH